MTSRQRAALKSYNEGWKRSRAFWAKERERREAESAERCAREREIVASELRRHVAMIGGEG